VWRSEQVGSAEALLDEAAVKAGMKRADGLKKA